jgi:hypothetical protein
MRNEIGTIVVRNFGLASLEDIADQILTLLIEEIKKELLTDEELGEIIRVNHDDRPFKSESAIARDTRQAQLQKILKKMEEK